MPVDTTTRRYCLRRHVYSLLLAALALMPARRWHAVPGMIAALPALCATFHAGGGTIHAERARARGASDVR